MRISEFEDQFGVPTPSPEEVAEKHDVPVEQILSQLEKGTEIEVEHTQDRGLAKEIALDHLWEYPDYYDRLEKVET